MPAAASAPAIDGGLQVDQPEVAPSATSLPAAPASAKRAVPGGGSEQRDGPSPPPRPPAPMASSTPVSVPPPLLPFEREPSDANDLLYSPPSWGGGCAGLAGGGDDGGVVPAEANSHADVDGDAIAAASSTPRRLSNVSASSVSNSVRGMLRYMMSPGSKNVSGSGAGARAAAHSSESSIAGGGGGGGESSDNAVNLPGGASMDGSFAGSEELWFGRRNHGVGFRGPSYSDASATCGDSTPRGARIASDVSAKSAAQSLLSMVKPSYWRSGGGDSVGDDGAGGGEANGDGGGEGEHDDGGCGLVVIGRGRDSDFGGMRTSFEESRSCSSMEDNVPVAEEMAMCGGEPRLTLLPF